MTFSRSASYIKGSTAIKMTATNLVPAALRSTGLDGSLTMRFSERFNRAHFARLAPGALACIAVLFSTWICFRLGLNLAFF